MSASLARHAAASTCGPRCGRPPPGTCCVLVAIGLHVVRRLQSVLDAVGHRRRCCTTPPASWCWGIRRASRCSLQPTMIVAPSRPSRAAGLSSARSAPPFSGRRARVEAKSPTGNSYTVVALILPVSHPLPALCSSLFPRHPTLARELNCHLPGLRVFKSPTGGSMLSRFSAVTVAVLVVAGSTACATKNLRENEVKGVNDKVDSLGQSVEETQERTRQERRRDRRRRSEGAGGAELGGLGAPGRERRPTRKPRRRARAPTKSASKADDLDKASQAPRLHRRAQRRRRSVQVRQGACCPMKRKPSSTSW